MKDVMGIIYAAEEDVELMDLVNKRSVAALPFGGRYRCIDFVLSNMVNSEIGNIGIITQNNYSSLMDHIGTGKEWDLNRRHDGLFMLSPYSRYDSHGWYTGDIDAMHSAMGYIRKSTQQYVIISGTHMVCNMNYDDAVKFHIDSGADITMIYKTEDDIKNSKFVKYTMLNTDEDGRITDIEVNPSVTSLNKLSMKMYIMEKSTFERLIEEGEARGKSDLIKDIVMPNLQRMAVYGYEYKGFLARLDSIRSYYKYSMMLLNSDIRKELFYSSGNIYTKIKDEVPAKYTDTAKVKNCLVADGCVIEGEVENCILFRGVRVCKGAKIRNSIIMQESEIQDRSVLNHVILDKKVLVKRDKRLIGQESFPVVIRKEEVI